MPFNGVLRAVARRYQPTTTAGVACAALLGLLSPVVALAAPRSDAVDEVDARATQIAMRVAELEGETRPGAFLTESEAVIRFQDNLFLHLIGEFGPAAEGFFALVTTGALADAGLHRDAEWYLAEALVGLENYRTAATRFQVIVDEAAHPFRDDAVRRLLELYAAAGDSASFRALYDAEVVPGNVRPTGLITYSLAKSFYLQDQYAAAQEQFESVPAESSFYGRAQYFLGVMAVRGGRLDDAAGRFRRVVELSVTTAEDRQVLDHALLALGRINYHLEDYFQASDYYNRIGGDSDYQADMLYEVVWTSIRRERWRDALNNVEIFLLAFPDHEFAAQLKLLQGHLNFQESNWADALEAYEQVITEYTPVQRRFASLALPGSSADAELRQVLETEDGVGDLPTYAVAMMRNDPELGRAMRVFRDLSMQQRDISVSERLITELRTIVQGSGAMGSYEGIRLEGMQLRTDTLRERLRLMSAHSGWLGTLSDPGVHALLPGLADRRGALEAELAVTEAELASARTALEGYERRVHTLRVEAENAARDADVAEVGLSGLRRRLASASTLDEAMREQVDIEAAVLEVELGQSRSKLQDIEQQLSAMVVPAVFDTVDPSATEALHRKIVGLAADYSRARPQGPGQLRGEQIDAADRSMADSHERLGHVIEAVSRVEGSEIGKIQRRFEREVTDVAQQRADHGGTMAAARTVSLDLTRDGFGRLEDFFADSVLKADMGIVDVYWAQKLEVSDELTRVRNERELLLVDLESRFRLIEEKLGEAP